MYILEVDESDTKKVQVDLPQEGLEIDPRVIYYDRNNYKFDCHIEGRTLTITRIDNFGGGNGWNVTLKFRVYNPAIEIVPRDFSPNSYTYHGLDGEQAPCDTVEVTVHSSVKVIRERAFIGCRFMKKCTMSDEVERIERSAFEGCEVMEYLHLSRQLSYIGPRAFQQCQSMDAVFLPNSLEVIEDCAFQSCTNMRILVLPQNIELSNVGARIVASCRALAKGMNLTDGSFLVGTDTASNMTVNEQVNYWLKCRLDNNLPFFKMCMDPSISVQMINEYLRQEHSTRMDGIASTRETELDSNCLTPLHILAMNPHATASTILACYNAHCPNSVFIHDNRNLNPMDYMWKCSKLEAIIGIIQALCLHRNNSITHTRTRTRTRTRTCTGNLNERKRKRNTF